MIMKRWIFILLLIGTDISFVTASTNKPDFFYGQGTVKFKNGDIYVGEYIKIKQRSAKKRTPDGDGVKTCVNGDRMSGKWDVGQFVSGVWYFANGDIFNGSCKFNQPYQGKRVYATEGVVHINNEKWTYPANCHFDGIFSDGIPMTGSFDTALTSENGYKYIGKLQNGTFFSGRMEFFNGDIFEGVFKDNQCYKGEYRYKSESIVQGINYHWVIPADCIFRGVVPTFTGRVDIAIYDVNKNQYIGNLKNGRPHGQGTMTYANGQSETGEWVDGMSPSAYQAYLAEQEAERQRKEAEQEAERQRKEAEQKRQQELYDAKCIKMFEEYLAEQSKKYKSPSIDLSNLYGEIPRGGLLKLCELLNGHDLDYCGKPYAHNITATIKNARQITISYRNPETGGQCTETVKNIFYLRRNKPEIDIPYPEDFPLELYEHTYICYPDGAPAGCEIIDADNKERQKQNTITKAEKWVRSYWIRKFGQSYGTAVSNRKAKLGMTIEMVQAMHEDKGHIERHISKNKEITTLSYGGNYFSFLGISGIASKYEYTFVNGRLIEFTSTDGKSSIDWIE